MGELKGVLKELRWAQVWTTGQGLQSVCWGQQWSLGFGVKQPEALWALASRSVKWNNNDSSLFGIIVRPLGTVDLAGGVLF